MKRENILLIIVVATLLIIAGFWFYNNYIGNNQQEPAGIILFYGDGCAHCAVVDDFIKSNNIEQKVKFTALEVFNNQDNIELLAKKAIFCGVDISQGAPVPFLWDTEKCFVGDQDIIKFFQEKIK